MFAALGRFTFKYRWIIALVYAVLVAPAVYLSTGLFERLVGGGFEDRGSESYAVYAGLEEKIKVGGADLLALYTAPSGSTVDDIEGYTAALEALARIEKDPGVVSTASWYTTQAQQLINKDKSRTFVLIALRGDDGVKAATMKRLTPLMEAPPLTLQLGGVIPVNAAVTETIASDLQRAEAIAFPITAFLLLLFFGSGASASLPLALGALSIAMALAALRILTHVTPVSVFAVNLVTLLGLGLAIDYSLFMVNRYREELQKRRADPNSIPTGTTITQASDLEKVEAAVVHTVTTTGRAVAFSGITVAASLCGLFAFPQMFLRSMAIGGIIVALGAVALAVTLLPALLAIFGMRINALKVPGMRTDVKEPEKSFWFRVALIVMKRPILVAFVVAVPLILVGTPFLRFNPSFPDYRVLPPDMPAFIANDILDKEFQGKQISPVDVLVVTPTRALDRDNLEKLYALSQRMEKLPNVTQVSGLFTLIPDVPKDVLLDKLSLPKEKQDPQAQMGIDAFSNGNYFRFAILLDTPLNDPASIALVREIRTWEIEGLDVKTGGPTAFLIDLKDTLVDKSPTMILIVCLVMFVVLFLVFGSVTLPIKAMIMNALSLTASFGAIVWVFQDGRFSNALQYVPLGISDCTAPLLMFSIVFGLSMDYEVLLLSRIREEYVRGGDNEKAVAYGLARTGSLITRAALLLFVVIVAFGTSHIIFMKSLGLGMALAILLDATIVRGLLVPALMKLMGKWNWWAPAPLVAAWKKMGLSDLEHD
jgi:trehalose monomycolate/heme transporter